MSYKTGPDLVTEAKERIREVTPSEVLEMMRQNAVVVYLDVREPNEWNLGHLPNAMHLPRGNLESNIEARVGREETIVIYCARGNRSALAADTLQQMGYENVSSMADGWGGWIAVGGDVED
ncbi:MAG TPA: rhodanese-like domain-containing protein [Gemmatimonadaceae bacterium]|nr:rhodanese-like domain-containing protein [Gemmatimonadaceae bacterium]